MANQKITQLDAITTLADTDLSEAVDMSGTPTNKKITWANIKATLETYFDTVYDAIGAAAAVAANLTTHEEDVANPHEVTKTQVGLSNVDNTSDATKNSASATLLNKKVIPRNSIATNYTIDTGSALDTDLCDIFVITAQAGALLFNNPGGTGATGKRLIIRIKDNGTARALTWASKFRALGNTLPTTTVVSKTLYLGFFYNGTDDKWDLVAKAQEA